MTNYQKGANFERLVLKDLRNKGWLAIRSAGSHSKIDILAVKEGLIRAIQCKTDGVISKEDREIMIHNWELHKAVPILAKKVKSKIIYTLITEGGQYVATGHHFVFQKVSE
jgi:Holliday junction resolvase